jgi:hypothetical protein
MKNNGASESHTNNSLIFLVIQIQALEDAIQKAIPPMSLAKL